MISKVVFLLKVEVPISERKFYIWAIIVVLLIFDLSQMPQNQVTAKILLFAIRQYQTFISPHIGGFVKCKFQPTCSHYAYTSIKWYGAFWGSIKAINRLMRCTPWSDSCGWDPP